MVTCLTVFAEGFESVEAIAPVDVLRRAGVEVTIAGLGSKHITSAQGVTVEADILLDSDAGLYDILFIPGGMPGSVNLARSSLVVELVNIHNAAGKIVAAICAAPAKVLAPNGVLDGRKATCYPGNTEELAGNARDVTLLEDKVVVDGNIVTSRGVGTALDLGYALVEIFFGAETVEKMRAAMIANW